VGTDASRVRRDRRTFTPQEGHMRRFPGLVMAVAAIAGHTACTPSETPRAEAAPPVAAVGQSGVKDDESQKDVVKIAAASKDHSTLVAAITAAGLVDALSNAGPFTVFAPTNAAFDALPEGTLANLLKAENLATLQGVLKHHVTTSALEVADLTDGPLSMADGGKVTISRKGSDVYVDGAKIVGSVRGSNGMVHVIDAVVVPPSK
jgi:uncharacterized surface protein with fasciclin (FAS1) repeats